MPEGAKETGVKVKVPMADSSFASVRFRLPCHWATVSWLGSVPVMVVARFTRSCALVPYPEILYRVNTFPCIREVTHFSLSACRCAPTARASCPRPRTSI